MTDDLNHGAPESDPPFPPRWVRDAVANWLAEELAAHPDDPDSAAARVGARVEADPHMVRAIGDALARAVMTSERPYRHVPSAEMVTPLVASLDRLREELSGDREFPCAAEVIRAVREEQETPG